jgi:16S rRNA (guanine966-N2)-methyltransferase
MSLRIIAGEKRGAKLQTPAGQTTRPTLGRIRESLFMILQQDVIGANVLDLFAGSGALGLEALSRGARLACFVENDPPALEALRFNVDKLGWTTRARVWAQDAMSFLRQAPTGEAPYDLILLDPPYGQNLAAEALELIGASIESWLTPAGIVVIQTGSRETLPEQIDSLLQFRLARYGATRIAFYRRGA